MNEADRKAFEAEVLKIDNERLKARVARLEDALQEYVDAHAHLAGVSDRVEQKVVAVMKESKQQSLAEVKAEVLCRAATDILDELGAHNASQWLRERMNRILQEAKDEQPNKNTIGSEAARILKKYDDA